MSQLALDLIAENKRTKSTYLDLGNCRLKDLPEELFECVWLEELVLSNQWEDWKTEQWMKSKNSGGLNRISRLPHELKKLVQLRILVANGFALSFKMHIDDINILSSLHFLEHLDITCTNVASIEPLAGLTKLKSLNLSQSEVTSIKPLANLINLNSLNISYTKISSIETISRLTKLSSLNLSFTSITSIEPLAELVKLKSLGLARTNINSIEPLSRLRNLEFLSLFSTDIRSIEPISGLTNLSSLNLFDSDITSIEPIIKLTNLESLNLSNTNISSIEPLSALIKLSTLDLKETKIGSIDSLSGLTNLNTLNLADTKIASIEPLAGLINLCKLDLSNTQVSFIETLTNFNKLTHLILFGTRIKYWENLYPLLTCNNLDTLDLRETPVSEKIPEEIINAGWGSIKNWILALKEDSLAPINEIKLLLLGNPNAGKTWMLHHLDGKAFPTIDAATHGIQYRLVENYLENSSINCWDFGGQEFYHATHQLFFSPGALHLVLWSHKDIPRNEQEKDTCYPLPYWLRCIEQLVSRKRDESDNKPIEVLVMENKIERINKGKVAKHFFYPTQIPQTAIQANFRQLNITFGYFNFKPKQFLVGLKELIANRAALLVNKHPNYYVDYLKIIRAESNPVISIQAFRKKKDIRTIENEYKDSFVNAIRVFHNMGILLYFPEIEALKDKVFIKPQALLYVLYNTILKDCGKQSITKEEITKALINNALGLYTTSSIALLMHFDLVFSLPEEPDTYFIPQYLKAASPLIDFFREHQFQPTNICIGSDNFMMNVVMLKIFSAYGKHVKKASEHSPLFWKDGIVIEKEKEKQILLVELNRERQTISLFQTANNFPLQCELVRFILDIPEKNAKKSRAMEETPRRGEMDWNSDYFSVNLSLDGQYFVDWQTLNQQVEEGIFQIKSIKKQWDENTKEEVLSHKTVSVFDFNKYIINNNQGKMKKIFISYSKDDLKLVNKFQEHLTALKMDGKVETWYCTELTSGGDWDHDIQANFEACHIVCFMISANFMRTKYIHEHEIKKAFERKKKDTNFRIVPIILNFCKWTTINNNLGTFTALPYTAKPVVDFHNQDMAWYIVQECLRIMIDNGLDAAGDDYYRKIFAEPGNQSVLPKDVLKIYERIVDGKVDDNV